MTGPALGTLLLAVYVTAGLAFAVRGVYAGIVPRRTFVQASIYTGGFAFIADATFGLPEHLRLVFLLAGTVFVLTGATLSFYWDV